LGRRGEERSKRAGRVSRKEKRIAEWGESIILEEGAGFRDVQEAIE